MTQKKILIVLIFGLCFFYTKSQTTDLNLNLSSNNVLDIKKQKNGLLWVATDEGLNAFYDNESYVFYSNIQDSLSLLNSKIDNLFISSSDALITLSQDGLSVFDNEKFSFKRIKLNSKPVSISEDNLTLDLWVATENSGYYVINSDFEIIGHYLFDPLSPLSISTSNLIENNEKSMIFENNKVYISTNNGFNVFDKKLKTFKRYFKGKKSLFTTNNIVGIKKMGSDNVMIATENELVVFNIKENNFSNRTGISGSINQLVSFSDKTILKSNSIQLKVVFDDDKLSVTSQKNTLPNTNEYTSSKSQLFHWDNGAQKLIKSDNDFKNKKDITIDASINSLSIYDDEILIGTNEGIKKIADENNSILDFNKFESSIYLYTYNDQIINISKNSIEITTLNSVKTQRFNYPIDFSEMSFESEENLIYIGKKDLHVFDINKKILIKSIVPGGYFKNYLIDNLKLIDDKLFVSHDNGVFEIPKNMFQGSSLNSEIIFYDYNELLNSNVPRGFVDIEKIENNYYVSTKQSGLLKYENDFNNLIKNFNFDGDNKKSLATSTPTKLLYSKTENTLYIGSIGSGLFKFDIDSEVFENLNISDGMLSGNVYDFLQVSEKLFFQSGTGINFIDENIIKNITSEDGLSPVSFHEESLHNIGDNIIVSGFEKIQYFSLESIENSNDKFLINSFNIVGIDELNNKKIIPIDENQIEIDYQTKSILFDLFSNNNYKSNQLQYFVEKIDSNELIKNGYNNQIQLSGLPYYTSDLNFYAVNGNGIRSENSIEISVYNAPPWWLRIETIIGYFIFLVGFVSFFVKYRERKTKERMEGERKSAELEEAKELQTSLLPKVLPSIEGFDISTYLKPATEIGGDYYDFFYKKGEYFYAICGDATGHGVISGIMVSVTKAGLHGVPMGEPTKILGQLNRIVKRVNFGRLRMSLSVAKFNKSAVELSSAAMPPTYFFSSKSKEVEEVLVPNLPLGGIESEKFDGIKKDFINGDVMVMISDGLPELPNPTNDLLDYEKVQECIKNNAEKSANEIKDALVYLSDEWANGVMNPDDITIVVIKKSA